MTEAGPVQRIDKWLWHARVVKTRSNAQKLVDGGNVRVDRKKVTASSFKLRQGNVLTITLTRNIRILEVAGFAEKRGSFEVAQTLYKDLTPKSDPTTRDTQKPIVAEIRNEGRPAKHERREAIRLKRNST